MRFLPLLAITSVLILLLVGLFVWPTTEDKDPTAAGGEAAATEAGDAAEIVSPGATSVVDRRGVVEDPTAEIAGETVEEIAVAPAEEGTGIVVRGTVLFAGDRQPAEGAHFVLHHATGYVELVADAEGRFATGPEIVPGVVRTWHMADPDVARLAQRLQFAPERFAAPADVEELEVELLLIEPEQWLRVEVTHADGRPAAGASVQFERWSEDSTGLPSRTATRNDADTEGHTSFAVYDPEALTFAMVVARGEGDLISESVTLATPLPHEPVRLVLDTGGRITARVLDGDGAPVPGQRLWITHGDEPTSSWITGANFTDDRGEVEFTPLAPGQYALGLIFVPGGGRVVDVLRGEVHEVELHLPPELTARAAAGTVIDEDGAPLAGVEIKADFDGEGTKWRTTDAVGRFEFHAAPCILVRLASNADVYGDEYDPAVHEVAYGTTDLVFQRTARHPRAMLSLEVVDAGTGERIEDVLSLSYRAPNLGSYGFHRGRQGLVSVYVSRNPDFRVAIGAPGYRRRHIDPNPLLDANPDGAVHRVELDRGLSQAVQVFTDTGDGAPLGGARVVWDGKVIGRSDAEGLMEIDLYQSVDELVFEADGHGAVTWDPSAWLSDLVPPWIWLTPDADGG